MTDKSSSDIGRDRGKWRPGRGQTGLYLGSQTICFGCADACMSTHTCLAHFFPSDTLMTSYTGLITLQVSEGSSFPGSQLCNGRTVSTLSAKHPQGQSRAGTHDLWKR